jgi:transketolase
MLRQGSDIALLATGPILGRTLKAADELAARGVSASVASFPTITPLDSDRLHSLATSHRAMLTIEEHGTQGGFGSRVADTLMLAGTQVRFGKYGVSEALRGQVGSQTWLLDQMPAIADRAAALL